MSTQAIEIILVLAIPCLVIVILFLLIWLFVKKGWGFFYPESNKEYVVLRGEFAVKYIRGDTTQIAEKTAPADPDSPWKIKTQEPKDMPLWQKILYKHFGIRYFGIPFICKLGTIIVNYPPQILSASLVDHPKDSLAPALDIHHNYLVLVLGVDFQGGMTLKLYFSLEITLVRPDVAWGRNGKFLDPLGIYIAGAVKAIAMDIPATDFIGKTKQKPKNGDEEVSAKVKTSKEWREEMCTACMTLNTKIVVKDAEGKEIVTSLPELCGYAIRVISYNDYKPDGIISEDRLNLLEKQNEALLKIEIAESEKKQAEINAAGAAATTTAQGMAKVAVDKANGLAQAQVEKAKGLADVVVLKAKTKALGKDVILTEINANATRDGLVGLAGFQGNTLLVNVGGASNTGVQPVVQLPTDTPKPKSDSKSDKPAEPK